MKARKKATPLWPAEVWFFRSGGARLKTIARLLGVAETRVRKVVRETGKRCECGAAKPLHILGVSCGY
jgi:hypothetical protein